MASSLLRDGQFAVQERIDGAEDNEYRELAEFSGRNDRDSGLLRYSRLHDPHKLLAGVTNLFTPRQEFHAAEGFAPAKSSFITEDEID